MKDFISYMNYKKKINCAFIHRTPRFHWKRSHCFCVINYFCNFKFFSFFVLVPIPSFKIFNSYTEKYIGKDHNFVWWRWEDSKSGGHHHVRERLRESLHVVRGWVILTTTSRQTGDWQTSKTSMKIFYITSHRRQNK